MTAKKTKKGLWANICITQCEPLGRSWQDIHQMTAFGWLFFVFEAICLHVTGYLSFSTLSRIDRLYFFIEISWGLNGTREDLFCGLYF